MRQEDMRQGGAGALDEKFGGESIREMALPARDALLEAPGAIGLPEQTLVMVGFQDQGVAIPELLPDQGRGHAQVGRHPHSDAVRGDDEADGLLRVVADRKGLDRHVAHLEGESGRVDLPCQTRAAESLLDGFGRGRIGVQIGSEALPQHGQSGNVIAMLVGQQDGADSRGIDGHGLEAAQRFPGAETGIDQQAGGRRSRVDAIARTSASQHAQPHGVVPRASFTTAPA